VVPSWVFSVTTSPHALLADVLFDWAKADEASVASPRAATAARRRNATIS